MQRTCEHCKHWEKPHYPNGAFGNCLDDAECRENGWYLTDSYVGFCTSPSFGCVRFVNKEK